jgi:HEAT repeat protein
MLFYELSFLPSDLLRDGLVVAIGFFTAMTFVQVGVLVTSKLVVEVRERQFGRLKAQFLDLLKGDARGAGQRPPRGRIEYDAFTDGCIELLAGAGPQESERIRGMARSCGVPAFYTAKFERKRSWMRRYQVIERLGFLNLPEVRGLYRTVMVSEKEHRLVAAKAVWALSRICREDDLAPLLQVLISPDFMSAKFNEYVWVNIIDSFRLRGEIPLLLRQLEQVVLSGEGSFYLAKDIVQALGSAGLAEGAGFISRCADELFSGSAEMRIACIRALQRTGGKMLEPMVVAGLTDQDWRIRAVAAKEVAKCSDRVIEALEKALGDSNYHVRMNAALSLAERGEAGRAVLRRHSQSPDRFTRDVTNYVLAV